jgi:hypothetical protein
LFFSEEKIIAENRLDALDELFEENISALKNEIIL